MIRFLKNFKELFIYYFIEVIDCFYFVADLTTKRNYEAFISFTFLSFRRILTLVEKISARFPIVFLHT